MSLNVTEIEAVRRVLHPALQGAVVREVISPERPRRIALVLRMPGENHVLQIVTDGGVTRIGRVDAKPKAASAPTAFVMLLRKMLTGAVVRAVEQVNADRVVALRFTRGDAPHTLYAELTSRHSNIFLADQDDIIVGSMLANRSRLRRLVPGEPYVPPFAHPLDAVPASRFGNGDDVERAIETHYAAVEAGAAEATDRQLTKRLLTTARRRLRKLRSKLDRDLERAEEAVRLGELAHVLKAHLKSVPRGSDRLDTTDFMGHPVSIPLDPRKGAVENMTQMFEKAKRSGEATETVEARMARVDADLEDIELFEMELEEADRLRRAEIREVLVERHPFLARRAAQQKGKTQERCPFREYVIFGGAVARVGRSARDNDTLTLKHARPGDLWLHVRGGTGSHVVVPLGRGADPAPELLVDAAHLAAHFSVFKKDRDVEIIYTRRRYVQKPRGAAPGSVRVIREKTLQLRVEADRLKRILGDGRKN